jgi:hypothetical protein
MSNENMSEPELLGIGILIWANIAVALGTIILAFFTYKSVKVSETQMELSRKLIEKPRILEKIHNILNNIESELEGERREIEKRSIRWSKENERNASYSYPLTFPLSEKKLFYRSLRFIFVGPEKGNKEIYSKLFQSIDKNLKERQILYNSTNGELYFIEKKIISDNFPERIVSLFSKLPEYSLNPGESGSEDFFISVDDGSSISKSGLYDLVTGIMISLMIDPSKSVEEISGYLGYQKWIKDLYPYIVDYMKSLSVPEINRRIELIFGDLNELDLIDKMILENVKSLKELYRVEYILTDNELTPFYKS